MPVASRDGEAGRRPLALDRARGRSRASATTSTICRPRLSARLISPADGVAGCPSGKRPDQLRRGSLARPPAAAPGREAVESCPQALGRARAGCSPKPDFWSRADDTLPWTARGQPAPAEQRAHHAVTASPDARTDTAGRPRRHAAAPRRHAPIRFVASTPGPSERPSTMPNGCRGDDSRRDGAGLVSPAVARAAIAPARRLKEPRTRHSRRCGNRRTFARPEGVG